MKYIWQCSSWPKLTWDSESLLPLLGQARLAQGNLLGRVKRLGFELGEEAQADILVEEAIKTAAIEGERLNPQTVRSSVARHLGLSTVGLGPTTRAVDGLIEVILDATQNYNKLLSVHRLKGWHAALFPSGYSGLHKILVGQWRGKEPMRVVSGPAGREKVHPAPQEATGVNPWRNGKVFPTGNNLDAAPVKTWCGVHFEAPPGEAVNAEMRKFLNWWESNLQVTDGLLRAGLAHFYFVTIHPFEDGNGRIARALTDMALAQDEKLKTRYYSLSSQIMEERDEYYDVLEKCSKAGSMDITNWLVWFLGCYQRAIQRSDKIIGNVLAKADFWQENAQAELNERQKKVLNRILEVGKGNFTGGLTTRKYVSIAKVSRATAFREISDMLDKKILRQLPGKGRSVHYDLAWPQNKNA